MIDIKTRYFSLNRTFLTTVGLWPYRTVYTGFQFRCIYVILITGIIFQLTPFLTEKCTINLFLKICSVMSFCVCFTIQYNSFYVNGKTVKYLMEQLQCICNNLKDNEISIMDKYGYIAKRYTIGLTMLAVTLPTGVFVISLYINLLRVNSTVNNSLEQRQQHVQLVLTEYFIDQDRYFSFASLHMIAVLWLGILGGVATGTMLIASLQYACGLFRIARFSTYLMSTFETSFLFLIIFGVATLSLNVFQVFQILSSTYDIHELLLHSILVLASFLYMFISNVLGQKILDHNSDVFASAYKTHWYIFPLRIQRLMVLLLQRGNKTFGLNVGGLFIASIQCFATLVNASLSYVTVMYSAR